MSEREKRGVEYEGTVPLETVLAYLDDLKARLTDGQVQVENGSASVLLSPAASIRLRVRAREKDAEQSLRFEIAWDRDERPAPSNGLSFAAPNGGAAGESPNGKRPRKKSA